MGNALRIHASTEGLSAAPARASYASYQPPEIIKSVDLPRGSDPR